MTQIDKLERAREKFPDVGDHFKTWKTKTIQMPDEETYNLIRQLIEAEVARLQTPMDSHIWQIDAEHLSVNDCAEMAERLGPSFIEAVKVDSVDLEALKADIIKTANRDDQRWSYPCLEHSAEKILQYLRAQGRLV